MIAAHAANQTPYAKLPYDSIKSFAHVSLRGMASEQRVAAAPELPTLVESGYATRY